MERHINIIGVLYIVLSALGILGAVTIYFVLRLVNNFVGDYNANMIISFISNIAAIAMVVFSIPGIIGGIWLIKRKNWARILILILSVLNLVVFPLGTAIGIYSIWVLIHPEITSIFLKSSKPQASGNT